MPLQATSGAASYDAFGGGVPVVPQYIEEVFSTYVYTGNSSTQVITNGIDLSTKGGLVWTKARTAAVDPRLIDTSRGTALALSTNNAAAQISTTTDFTNFNSNGYTLGTPASSAGYNSSYDYVSWTFRKQPKFFDIVTFTGDNTASLAVNHNLGSVPGCVIVKRTDAGGGWFVWHRATSGTPNNDYIRLEQTSAVASATNAWSSNAFTSTQFFVSNNLSTNVSGATYVAYLFAHDAGGFGLTGTDNVISCGSYTGNSVDGVGGTAVDLGFEPQFLMVKCSSNSDTYTDWSIFDNMRGCGAQGSPSNVLYANRAFNENYYASESIVNFTATGFQLNYSSSSANFAFNKSGATYIYIAIRRGPMKVPTSGTSVYNAVSRTGTGSAATITGIGFAPDLLDNQRTTAASFTGFFDRLRGGGTLLYRALDDPDTTVTGQTTQFNTTMDGFAVGTSTASDSGNNNTVPYIWHCYKRAPSVFDIVCYTGNGSTQNVSHNLGVAPELIIAKSRSLSGSDWWVYASPLTTPQNKYLRLQSTDGESTVTGLWGSSLPTSTTFGLGAFAPNSSGATFVAYLFGTAAGVSKVGSYTGTGTTKQIDCGFTGGARFVLIKRTDSTGAWYVWDTARGIVSGNDPYLLWNSTAAEVTNTDYIDTYSAGFEISSTAPAAINASGGSFIFLAIA